MNWSQDSTMIIPTSTERRRWEGATQQPQQPTSRYLVLHQRRHGQVVEQFREAVPHGGVAVLAEALVVEPVDLGDLAGLVVAPQNGDAVLKPNLPIHR